MYCTVQYAWCTVQYMSVSSLASTDSRTERYLDVAQLLFAEHGFDGTTTDMIVEEAGGSKATLYKRFASKEALIDGLIQRISDGVGATGSPNLDDLDLESALHQIGTVVTRAALSETAIALLRLALGNVNRFPQLAAVVWHAGPGTSYPNFRAFLEARRKLGEVDFDDAQLAAEHFLAGLVGHLQPKIALGVATAPSEEEVAARVASAVSAFLMAHDQRSSSDQIPGTSERPIQSSRPTG